MALPVGKLAPTAVVAAMVTYVCWPHLTAAPVGKSQEAAKIPQIGTHQLSPVIAAPSERDPFNARPSTAAAATVLESDDEPKASADHETASATDKGGATHSERWLLNATLVRGDRRLAVIDGKLYATGEPLASPDSSDARYVISEIDVDKVVIRGPGHVVALRYEDLSAMTSGAAVPQTNGATRNVSQGATKQARSNLPTPKPGLKQSNKTEHRRHE